MDVQLCLIVRLGKPLFRTMVKKRKSLSLIQLNWMNLIILIRLMMNTASNASSVMLRIKIENDKVM